MAQDFNLAQLLSEKFNKKSLEFYKSLHPENINYYMYKFGVGLKSYHLTYKDGDIILPYVSTFKPLWNLEIWQRANWGTDDTKPAEVYEKEFDDAMIEGVSEYDYLVSNAVKYHRPAWVIFGLLGMMQGQLNCAYFEAGSLQQGSFDKNDYISAASYLSSDFLSTYSSDLLYLFSYFDEAECTLVIDTIKASLIIVEG